MRHFTDAAGRQWNIAITVKVLDRCRSKLKIDLADLYLESGEKVFSDPILFINLMYVVCEDEATTKGITDVQFGEGMFGDPLETSATALMEAISDFFPSRKRALLMAQLAKAKEIDLAMMARATKAVNDLTPEQFFKPLTNLAVSSGSTPEISASGN